MHDIRIIRKNSNHFSKKILQRNTKFDLDNLLDLVGLEEGVERSFWEVLHEDQIADNPLVGRDLQKFILNVFFFIISTYN